jgi:energy-converting hydrogenase Eha subunit A
VIAVTLVAAVIAGVVTVAAVDLSAWHARVVRDRPARFSQR